MTLNDIAQAIKPRSASFPITIRELSKKFGLTPRTVKGAVQTLRGRGFPIGANRQKPYGYWWISTPQEMEAFVRQYRSQAMNELRILQKMVRINYPQLIGQLRLPFTDPDGK